LKAQAERLPYGDEREALERNALQLEIASHINEWVFSPGLQPPVEWRPDEAGRRRAKANPQAHPR
jgi:hypothetical protein